MAVSSKRTTRSMAAAARRPSTPAEYKMEDSLTLKAEVDTTALQDRLDHSEGAKWLLANQDLLDGSKVPTLLKEDDFTSIKAKEELDVKAFGSALGLRDGGDRAVDQGSPELEHRDPYLEDETAFDQSLQLRIQLDSASPSISDRSQATHSTPSTNFSDRDTNILRPHQKVATSDEDTTTVKPSDIGESRSQLEVADGNLREPLQTRRTITTALEEERAILAKNLLFLWAHISSSGAQMIAEREANLAEPRNQEAELANKMSNPQQDFSGREDKIVEQEAKIAAMQQEKADLANKLKLVQSDFRQLEDLIQTERLNQVNELAYLEEQLVAFNQLIVSLEDENNQLKQIVDQQHLEDQMDDHSTFDEASSDVDATDQSRINEVEEENQSLKSKLIDTLDKLVAAQSRLDKFATAQTHAAGFSMPLEGQQGTKRPGSVYTEPAAKKFKDLRPPNLEFLQSSNMSSEDHYLCLVPQQSVSGSEENVGYALKSILNS